MRHPNARTSPTPTRRISPPSPTLPPKLLCASWPAQKEKIHQVNKSINKVNFEIKKLQNERSGSSKERIRHRKIRRKAQMDSDQKALKIVAVAYCPLPPRRLGPGVPISPSLSSAT